MRRGGGTVRSARSEVRRPTSDLERWVMPNGLTVLYRRDTGFPLACATLLFPTGSHQESVDQAGLCSMTLDLLMQGTRRRDARQIASMMESVGASMGTQAHEDYSEMGFIAPAAEMDRALGLMAEILIEPSFPGAEIVKEKSHVVASLNSRRDAIFNFAFDHLNGALYGQHPYGRPLEGRIESVTSFRRQDFQAWHREHIVPAGVILSIIAPLPVKSMRAKLEKTVGRWKQDATRSVLSKRNPPVDVLTQSVTRQFRSSFQQAYLMVGWQVPSALHPDQISLKVLNALLGGGMSSMLFITLRERLGLAYEVSSFYPTRLDTSQWVIYLGLPAEKLKTAGVKLNDLLEKLAKHGPSATELKQAKMMIRGAFLMDRQSRRRQAWYAAWWEFLGRGPGYGEEFLKAIDAVSVKTVHALLKKILKQPRVTVTVVPK